MKMKKKIKKWILGGLAGILLSGCANLPKIYKSNLTANSSAFKEYAIKTISKTSSFPEKARLVYLLDNLELENRDFSINNFENKNKKIAYSKWKTENSQEILIYLNGLESHSGWFDKPAEELAKKGIVVYGLDRRGSGLNTRIKGSSNSWLEDINKIINIAKDENPDLDINLASLCFGSRLSTNYAIKNPEKIDSLVYISPGFNMKIKPNCLETISIVLDCLGVQTNTKSPIKKNRMFTDNSEYLRFLNEDKLRTCSPNSDTYIKGENLLKKIKQNLDKIKIPSLVLLASSDDIIDIKKTKKTLRKFGKPPKIIEYPGEHTIFFGSPKNQMIKDIVKFIKQ